MSAGVAGGTSRLRRIASAASHLLSSANRMPYDSTLPSGPTGLVSADTVAALGEAIRRFGAEELNGELRAALTQLSDEARAKGVRAEQLIILLKQVWNGLPMPAVPRDERARMLERLVTLCINEYYADR